MTGKLIWRDLQVRAVEVPLRRPVISKVGLFEKIPLILLDLETEQGIVGRSYIVPYLTSAVHYLVPVLRDLGAAQKGRPVAPFDSYGQGRKALGLLGFVGAAVIIAATYVGQGIEARHRARADGTAGGVVPVGNPVLTG